MKKSIKQKLSAFLLIIFILTNSLTIISNAAQSSLLGSQAALGSPLTSDSFVVDDWDPWEMLCFGIFLSNFCQPFEDDYTSAFTEGSPYGTKGRGLKALQFSAGGDATTSGYLHDMVEFCKSSQAESYRNIYVDYSWYEYNEKLDSFNTSGTRQAYVDDLFPKLYNYDKTIGKDGLIKIFSNKQVSNPMIAYSFIPLFHGNPGYGSKSEDGLIDYVSLVDVACLPMFYASKDGYTSPETLIFDYTDNWDIQIIKALFAKTFNLYGAGNYAATESGDEAGMESALEDTFKQYLGRKCPLIMDTYGNICMQYQGRNIIIIPASANQHITAQNSYNYLNSLVLNNYVLTGSDTDAKIVGYAESELPTTNEGFLGWTKIHRVGNFPVKHTEKIADGRLLIHSDTDTQLFQQIYKELKEMSSTGEVTEPTSGAIDPTTEEGTIDLRFEHNKKSETNNPSEFLEKYNFGKVVGDLVGEKTFYQQAIQFDITGASSIVTDNKFSWTGKGQRDNEEVTINTSLGALGLLSTMFSTIPTVEEANTLDYLYIFDAYKSLDETKEEIFSDSYFITPRLPSKTNNIANQSEKLYVNYFMQAVSGQVGLESGIFNKNDDINSLVKTLWESLSKQNGFVNTGMAMLTVPDEEQIQSHSNNAKANTIYKLFMEKYYNYTEEGSKTKGALLDDVTLDFTNSFFDSSKSKVNSLAMISEPNKRLSGGVSRVCRVYKPSERFKAVASVFSLDDACQFELYSTYIYITYLDFYGFLNGSNNAINNFNQSLFDGAYFRDFSGDNLNGITAEQRDEAVKLNVFKILSLDEVGGEYRKHLAEDFVENFIVKPLDEKLNKTSVGNIGVTSNYLHVSTLEDNFAIGDLIKNYWGSLSLILFGILSIVAIFSGALNHKSISWYMAILISSVLMVYSIPFYLDITPIILEKYINTHYGLAGSYWALSESIHLDKTTGDLMESTSDVNKAVALLNTLNFLDTDSTLMIKQDISQKVVSVSAIDYKELQRLKTARWLLPGLMQQMSSTRGNNDYVSVPVTRLYNNYARLWVMYHEQADYMPSTPSGKDAASKAEQKKVLSLVEKQNLWGGTGNEQSYKNTGSDILSADKTTKSITRLANNQPTHTGYYLLDGLFLESVYSELGKSYITKDDWEEYAKKVDNHSEIFLKTNSNKIKEAAENILNDLNSYNQYSDPIKQEFGYLWTTENLGPYFYLVTKDTFEVSEENIEANKTADGIESSIGSSLAYIMLQLQGSKVTNEGGQEVRTSFMHYGETGYIRDVCDIEEVFTNLMPYMYQMMVLTNGSTDHTGVLGAEKMIGNPYYSDNYKSWMFRCNWVTKIYEDSLYHSKKTVVARDENGNKIGEYIVDNISDPRSYPVERPMVFSEAQMHEQHLTDKDLTFTELKILDFNQNVVNRWTTLVNYANTVGLTKEHVYRQMAVEALFAFNQTFTRDNMIVSSKTMYPLNYDLRNLSLITLLRSLVSNLTKNNTYMYNDLALHLYKAYGFSGYLGILAIYWSFLGFASMRDFYMILAFISAVATLLFNFASSSTEKYKSMFGWVITSAIYGIITITYYWIINFLIGNPTPDTLLNINQITSTKFSSWSFGIWAIFIVVLTIIYISIIVIYFYQLWIGHKFGLNIKDGGFGFYYSMTDKVVSAVKDVAGKAGKHLSGIHDGLAKFGPAYEPVQNKTDRIKTDAKLDGGKAGSYIATKNKTSARDDFQGIDLNSSFNTGDISDGSNVKVNDNIQKMIMTGKKIDDLGIDNKLQTTINNLMSATIDFNSNPVNINEKYGINELQKIADKASDSYIGYGIQKAKYLAGNNGVYDAAYNSLDSSQKSAMAVFEKARAELESQGNIKYIDIDSYSYQKNGFAGGTIEKLYGSSGGISPLD